MTCHPERELSPLPCHLSEGLPRDLPSQAQPYLYELSSLAQPRDLLSFAPLINSRVPEEFSASHATPRQGFFAIGNRFVTTEH